MEHVNKKETSKIIVKIISGTVFALLIAFLSYLIVGSAVAKVKGEKFYLFGTYSFEIVMTPSMEDSVRTGSLVIVKKCDINDIEVGENGDIVCFRAQQGPMTGNYILHRAVGSYRGEDGKLRLSTKGDNNPLVDQTPEGLGEVKGNNFCGKSVFVSYPLGRVISFIRQPINLSFFAFCLIALSLLGTCIKNLKKSFASDDADNRNTEP